MRSQSPQSMKWVFIAFVVLTLNSGYLAAFSEPALFHMLNVLLHAVLGVALVIPFFIVARRYLENDAPKGGELAIYMGRLGYWCLSPAVFTGVYLVAVNATHSHQWILYFHIVAGFVGVAFFQKSIRSVAHKVSVKNPYDVAGRLAWVIVVISILLPLSVRVYKFLFPSDGERIVNPAEFIDAIPASVFAPSAASTSTQKNLAAEVFLNSASCGRSGCHPDIYQQWQSSAHRYSSFNNLWYRQAVKQFVADAKAVQADTNNHALTANPAKWCAGCHDPAVLLSGKFEQTVEEVEKMPEAQAGISCTACHSITQVRSTRGQADYVIEAMPLNDWATSENKFLQGLYDYLVRLNPEPHRKSMSKPFHHNDDAEFCSACHKAHLDRPVNQYRWIRSFNDYDAWHAGPFSGRSSRGAYSAREGKSCSDCHMPLAASKDAGSSRGKIRSHHFLGANTALPTVNQDDQQIKRTTKFLRDKQVTVDIFAVAKSQDISVASASSGAGSIGGQAEMPILKPATLFAFGDEQRMVWGKGSLTSRATEVTAPISQRNVTVSRGEDVRVDVVVRSRNVGHFFPSGTVDAHEVWVELQAVDEHGQIIFWSGAVADGGKGPVDSSAHFYRSYLVDHTGKHIDKNNLWAAREAVYVNLIPPGGADVVHYRLKIPTDCGNKIYLSAKLNYRKFSPAFAQWVFADSLARYAASHDAMPIATVAVLQEIPIVAMACDSATLAVGVPETTAPAPTNHRDPRLWERWNDYGLGLLAQGDLKSAEAAFLLVAQNVPTHADAWINAGIARLQAGDWARAQQALETALKMESAPFRAHFYYGVALKAQGQYDEALKSLKRMVTRFPRDRVAKIERGELYLQIKDYNRAIIDFEKVLSIDPENVEAYYFLEQAYRAIGDTEKAQKAEKLYARFQASARSQFDNSQALFAPPVWRERQPIHEHVSAILPVSPPPPESNGKTFSGK